MTEIDPNLLAAAGFTGAGAQQSIATAQAKNQIDQAQIALQGDQQRQNLNNQYENSGMYNSSRRDTAVSQNAADQADRSQLATLGMNDTINRANISVMQELANQKLQQDQLAQQRSLFDQQMQLEQAKANAANPAIDYATLQQYLNSLLPQSQPTNLDNSAGMQAWRDVHSRGW